MGTPQIRGKTKMVVRGVGGMDARTCVQASRAGNAGRVRGQRRRQHFITDILADYKIAPGDVSPARGRSCAAGSFIAEIQQTSNITYRIYDFNRRDANGNTGELHRTGEGRHRPHRAARLPDALRAGAGHARGAGVVPFVHHVALRSDPPRSGSTSRRSTRSSWRIERLRHASPTTRAQRFRCTRAKTVLIPASARSLAFTPDWRHEDSDKLDRLIRLFGFQRKNSGLRNAGRSFTASRNPPP